jgi:hypothetical protein
MATTQHEENDGIHIEKIIGAVPCPTHAADINQACWNVNSVFGINKAICDRRARSAGANGVVTPYKTHAETRVKKKEYNR